MRSEFRNYLIFRKKKEKNRIKSLFSHCAAIPFGHVYWPNDHKQLVKIFGIMHKPLGANVIKNGACKQSQLKYIITPLELKSNWKESLKSSMFLSIAPHLFPWLTCLNPLYMVQISCLVNFVEVMRSLSWTVFLFLCASLWVTASWRSNPSSIEWVSARSKICSLMLWLKLCLQFVCAHEQCYFGIMRRGPYLQGVTPGRNNCPQPLQERKFAHPFLPGLGFRALSSFLPINVQCFGCNFPLEIV